MRLLGGMRSCFPSLPIRNRCRKSLNGHSRVEGWIQVFRDSERAGNSSVTFSVSDLKAEVDHLRSLDLSVGDVQESKQVKILIINDPDGNQLVFAQPLTADLAQ